MNRFTEGDVTVTQTKKCVFSLYLYLLRLPRFASHGLERSSSIVYVCYYCDDYYYVASHI